MALATYADLQASVANWLHRSDLAAIIPDMIRLAEARLNRLTLRILETETVLPFAAGDRTTPLPADYLSPVGLWAPCREPVPYVTPEALPITDAAGLPAYWAVDGGNVALDKPLSDAGYTLTLRYRRSFALSDATPTNWLLTNAPDVYLYGALLQSAPYLRDDARIATWQVGYADALQGVKDMDSIGQGLTTLRADDGLAVQHFDFVRG